MVPRPPGTPHLTVKYSYFYFFIIGDASLQHQDPIVNRFATKEREKRNGNRLCLGDFIPFPFFCEAIKGWNLGHWF